MKKVCRLEYLGALGNCIELSENCGWYEDLKLVKKIKIERDKKKMEEIHEYR